MGPIIARSVFATAVMLVILVLGCKDADRKLDHQPGTKIILLGENYGGVKVEELGEVSVTAEVEKPADVTRVRAREDAPPDRTFNVPPGTYRAYRLKAGEKQFGKVFTERELAAGSRLKDLRSVGWVRLDGKTNGGVGEMTGIPVLVMEGALVSP